MSQRELLLSARKLTRIRSTGDTGFRVEIPRFDLGAGDRVALIGPSGSGKSTVIAMIALAMAPEPEGQLLLRDRSSRSVVDVNRLWCRGDDSALAGMRRATFGYVQQVGGLLPFMTVGQNLTVTQEISQCGTRKSALDLARRVGISELLDRYPRTLSVGQRQRACIAQALAHDPEIIVADEPTAALDRSTAASVLSLLVEQAEQRGVALLLATHDVALSDHFGFERVAVDQNQPSRSLVQRRRPPGNEKHQGSRREPASNRRGGPGREHA